MDSKCDDQQSLAAAHFSTVTLLKGEQAIIRLLPHTRIYAPAAARARQYQKQWRLVTPCRALRWFWQVLVLPLLTLQPRPPTATRPPPRK